MADALDLVTLAEAKAFLNMDADDTSEDSELSSFITGITKVIESGDDKFHGVGPVVEREQTAIVAAAGYCYSVSAPAWPIASLTSGAYLDDDSTVDITQMIADRGLLITKNYSPFPARPWTLTFQAGRVAATADVPQNIKNGALEVLKLAWTSQRGGQPPAFLIPYRAAAWLTADAFALGFA